MLAIDTIDRRILTLLQTDASVSCVQIASAVGLSQAQCSRRIERVKREGWIVGIVALLDRHRLGAGTQLFVRVKLRRKDPTSIAEFSQAIRDLPEVLDCHALLGSFDFMLRVVVPDFEAYRRFHAEKLNHVPHVCESRCTPSLGEVKYTTFLPLPG
jgi:Lrp/AsnC family transcriptional regulator